MIEGSGEERARMTMTTAIVRMYAYEGDILKFRDSTKAPSLPPSLLGLLLLSAVLPVHVRPRDNMG